MEDVTFPWGRTFIYDGLAQTDIDMAHFRLLNLDTTNLPPIGIPPTIHPPVNKWLHDWDGINHVWTATQPRFQDLAEYLTTDQMTHINSVGVIRTGHWDATPLSPAKVPILNLIRVPDAALNMNFKRIINLADPAAAQDAVNLAFVQAVLPGLKPKEAARCATVHGIGSPSGLQVIDGVTLQDGDRVLVKNQASGLRYHNGIWVAHAGSWTRPADFDGLPDDSELVAATVFILEGTNAGTTWVQLTASPVHLSINPSGRYPVFVIFSATSALIVPGTGLTRDGNTLNVGGTPGRILVGPDNVDIDPAYPGQDSITNLGHVTEGRWNAELIEGAYGGTGVNNFGRKITLIGDLSTAVSAFADDPTAVEGSPLRFGLLGPTLIDLPLSGIMVTTDGGQTLTNKRIQKRVASFTAFARPAIDTDAIDVYKLTAQDQPILSFTDNLTGAPTDGQDLYIFIEEMHEFPPPPAPPDIPIVQSFPITWGDAFRDSPDLKLPEFTVGLAGTFLRFVFNADHGKWWLVNKVEDIGL